MRLKPLKGMSLAHPGGQLALWSQTYGTALWAQIQQALFGSGEQGLFVPSINDARAAGRLFQDAAGTTPATAVDDPVGLILDYHKGTAPGPELVANGRFDSDTSGWAGARDNETLSIVGGKLRVTADSSGAFGVSYKITSHSTGTFRAFLFSERGSVPAGNVLSFRNDNDPALNSPEYSMDASDEGDNQMVVSFSSVSDRYYGVIAVADAAGEYFEIDNISVQEIPGNHLSQSTATARPLLKQDGNGDWYLQFDATDDALAHASLGTVSDATVVLIGADGTWIDDAFDHTSGSWSLGYNSGEKNYTGGPSGIMDPVGGVLGVIVLDRQLTASERQAVIDYGNNSGAAGHFELGDELVTNGDFSSGITGWTETKPDDTDFSVVAGRGRLEATGGTSGYEVTQGITTQVGAEYIAVANAESDAGNSAIRARVRWTGFEGDAVYRDLVPTEAGVDARIRKVFVSSNANNTTRPGVASTAAWGSVGDISYFDNISLRKLTLVTP